MNYFKTYYFFINKIDELPEKLSKINSRAIRAMDIINMVIEPFEMKQFRVMVTTWERA